MILYSYFRLTLLSLGHCLFYISSFPSWDLCFCTVPPAISLRSIFHSLRLSSQARFIVSPMSGASLSIFSLFVWAFTLHRFGFDWFVCAVGQLSNRIRPDLFLEVHLCDSSSSFFHFLVDLDDYLFCSNCSFRWLSFLSAPTIHQLFLSKAVLLLESFKIFYFFFRFLQHRLRILLLLP